jgi:hypothetical protein
MGRLSTHLSMGAANMDCVIDHTQTRGRHACHACLPNSQLYHFLGLAGVVSGSGSRTIPLGFLAVTMLYRLENARIHPPVLAAPVLPHGTTCSSYLDIIFSTQIAGAV